MFPYSHEGTITLSEASGAASALAQEQLRPAPRSSASGGRVGSREGSGQHTPPSTSAAKQRQKSLICSTTTGPHVVQAQPGATDFITSPNDPTSSKDVHHPSHQRRRRWRLFPSALVRRRAFAEELKKTLSGQNSDASESASENWYDARPYSSPSAERAARSRLSVPGGRRGRRTLAAGKAGARIAGTSLAGGVTNPWQSTKPKAILKSATGIWQLWKEPPWRSCAFTMLCEGGCGSWGALTWWERTVRQEDAGQSEKRYHRSKHC